MMMRPWRLSRAWTARITTAVASRSMKLARGLRAAGEGAVAAATAAAVAATAAAVAVTTTTDLHPIRVSRFLLDPGRYASHRRLDPPGLDPGGSPSNRSHPELLRAIRGFFMAPGDVRLRRIQHSSPNHRPR